MPRKAKSATISELRRQLAAKERKLATVLNRREKLVARLQAIDEEILAMGGEVPTAKRKKRRKARKATKAAKTTKATKGKARRKRAGRKPVGDYIAKVLAGAADGLRIKDIAPAVIKAGYKTRSKDFYGIIATAVRSDKRFKKIRRGVYALA